MDESRNEFGDLREMKALKEVLSGSFWSICYIAVIVGISFVAGKYLPHERQARPIDHPSKMRFVQKIDDCVILDGFNETGKQWYFVQCPDEK